MINTKATGRVEVSFTLGSKSIYGIKTERPNTVVSAWFTKTCQGGRIQIPIVVAKIHIRR